MISIRPKTKVPAGSPKQVSNPPKAYTKAITESANRYFLTDAEKAAIGGGGGGGGANLAYNAATRTVTSDSGTDAILTLADAVNPGLVTTAQFGILNFITVTQPVNLDTLEADTVINNAKVTNATHTGEVTGSGALTLHKTALTNRAIVTAVGTDYVLISDTSDSDNLKRALVSDLAGSSATNLAYDAATRIVSSDTGADATLTLADGTNPGLLSSAQFNKLGFIAVTQAVDLDVIESDTVLNNAKITNATHTGEVTGSGTLTLDKTAVTNKTVVTADNTDHVLIADASDSGNLKRALISDFTNATHTGEVTGATTLTLDKTAITNRTIVSADNADYFLLTDTSDSNNLKRALISDMRLATNLAWVAGTSTITSDTGTDATLTLADVTNPGLLSSAQFNKLGFISITQAVDLDTLESDTVLNNAKVTNATHTGEVTGSGVLTAAKTLITNKTLVTAALDDKILIADTSDSDNLKYATAQSIALTFPSKFKETQLDFGASPVLDKMFTVIDTDITVSSNIIVLPSGNAATGRVGVDFAVEAVQFVAVPGSGQFTIYALSLNGNLTGNRKVFYIYN